MKRLTARNKDGTAYYVACFEMDAPCGTGNPGPACAKCDAHGRQCEALAAYEERIGDLNSFGETFTEDAIIHLAAQSFGTTPERLRELTKADAEGRVKVYALKNTEKCCGNCGHFRREPGTRHGTCAVRPTQSRRYGLDRSIVFTPVQSRLACKQFCKKEDLE